MERVIIVKIETIFVTSSTYLVSIALASRYGRHAFAAIHTRKEPEYMEAR
jgi:hypothetical protein